MRTRLSWKNSALIVFITILLLLCVVLAVFAVREVERDQLIKDEQLKIEYQTAAQMVSTGIKKALNTFESRINAQLEKLSPTSSEENLTKLCRQIAAEEEMVDDIFIVKNGRQIVFPLSNNLYQLTSTTPLYSSLLDLEKLPKYKNAITFEFVDNNYSQAITLYDELYRTAQRDAKKAALLNAIGRCFLNANKPEDAVRIYETLIQNHSALLNPDGIPYGIIARFQAGKILLGLGQIQRSRDHLISLFNGLLNAQWSLPKSQFNFYIEKSRELIQSLQESIDETEGKSSFEPKWTELLEFEQSQRKRMARRERLSQQTIPQILKTFSTQNRPSSSFYRFFETSGDEAWLTASRSLNQDLVFGFLYDTNSVINRLLPPLLASAPPIDNGKAILLDSSGAPLSGKEISNDSATPPVFSLAVSLDQDFYPWTIAVYEQVPGLAEKQFRQKRILYLLTVTAVIFVLLFGGYLAIRSTAKELKLARLQAEFVSTVSHEFRTPLMSIRYLGELLQRGRIKGEGKKQEYYETITTESKRLGRLIENTLDFSKIEAGMKKYSFEESDIGEILDEAVAHFQKQFLEDKFVLEKNIAGALPRILADKEALSRAVLNLLDNAAKYSGTSRKIVLRSYIKGNDVCTEIEDFGVGIPEHEQKRVFEKFYRAEGVQNSPIKGSGIGLTIVAHTARAHGGDALLVSAPGKGTKITLKIPIKKKGESDG